LRAARLHADSLALFESLNVASLRVDYYSLAEANDANGEAALAMNEAALATRHFARTLELARQSGFQNLICWAMAGLAGAAFLNENPARAVRLWGAAEALRQSISVREAPASGAVHRRLMALAREQLGEAVFAAEWAAGQALTLEAAVAEATAEI
jgi:hypothetical protein